MSAAPHMHVRDLPGRISWVRYVRHGDRPAFEAMGWVFAGDLGPTHGQWSALLQWAGEGEPREPVREAR